MSVLTRLSAHVDGAPVAHDDIAKVIAVINTAKALSFYTVYDGMIVCEHCRQEGKIQASIAHASTCAVPKMEAALAAVEVEDQAGGVK